VTGAASGIGGATAVALAELGHPVVLVDQALDRLATVAGTIDGPSISVGADLASEEAPAAVLDQAVAAFGTPRVLVNAAGILVRRSFLDHDAESWDRTLAVDLDAPFWLSCAFVRRLLATDASGSIVNVASIESIYPLPGHAAYSAAKGALLMLTKAMAVDLAKSKIRVNAVCPGVIATRMNADLRADFRRSQTLAEEIPLGRFGEPVEVAAAISFLASDRASYVTGTYLLVDGGWSAH
jgi:NAD(P)-dependent dehydrogenase (short-subunit alcohol dehydrogenase family)